MGLVRRPLSSRRAVDRGQCIVGWTDSDLCPAGTAEVFAAIDGDAVVEEAEVAETGEAVEDCTGVTVAVPLGWATAGL